MTDEAACVLSKRSVLYCEVGIDCCSAMPYMDITVFFFLIKHLSDSEINVSIVKLFIPCGLVPNESLTSIGPRHRA